MKRLLTAITINRCKYCGARPERGHFGRLFETYCPEMDSRKCKAPPSVEASTQEEADKLWNQRFGAEEIL